MRHLWLLAILGCGLAAAAPARANHLTMTTPWSPAECRNLEGFPETMPDGSWSCCFREIRQCWRCPTGFATETNPCTCSGSTCPPDAKIGRLYREADRHESKR